MSQGQKQRIALARIFLRNPDVIILDEPTASLDRENTNKIIKTIKRKYGEEKIVLLISHNSDSLSRFNQIMIIKDRKITIKT
ncbi:ATP-binding cassette domain-containing protein [Enterococcus sp.]|uniref:ATP-binding cassette domain-containing protein n=1 Tax=Enterococcus sp. TaxID=35783 RepID=UPI003FA55D8D